MQYPQLLALVQGGYFVATGLWPLAHLRSFEAVTGPKVDKWLVKMVGLLAVAIGAPLVLAGMRGEIPTELRQVAVLSAVAFLAVDVVYSARRRIRPIYLADAAFEGALILGWILSSFKP